MDVNENQVAAAGGVLGALVSLWLGFSAAVRLIRAAGEWKGRMEANLERNAEEIALLRGEVRAGFSAVNGRIDALLGLKE